MAVQAKAQSVSVLNVTMQPAVLKQLQEPMLQQYQQTAVCENTKQNLCQLLVAEYAYMHV